MAGESNSKDATHDFWSIAKILGHDEALKAGSNEVTTTIKPKNLEHARELFSRCGAEERAKRQKIFFDRIGYRARRPEGRHDRAFSYILADGQLNPDDEAPVDVYLKHLDIQATSIGNMTLGPNEVKNLGTSTTPVILNIDVLTMEPGSRLEIYNTVLSLTCQKVIRNGSTAPSASAANYDIGIFGVKPPPPAESAKGGVGGEGDHGDEGTCKCSGTEPGNNGTKGLIGGQGGEGAPGGPGDDGLPALLAEITILESLTGTSAALAIKSQGGAGAVGGKGGKGGTGGVGGKGGDGKRCAGTCTNGGDGGPGGPGGLGGPGGQGGNGATAEDVLVTVPADVFKRIFRIPLASEAGDGGPGGDPGDGGDGGPGGAGVSHNICDGGNKGTRGKPGTLGTKGPKGDHGGLAGRIIINGEG